MSIYGDIIWASGSTFLRCLHMPLLKELLRYTNVSVWEYIQYFDESACIDTAVELLHSHLKNQESTVNLIGHGIGGTIALIYARKYPQFIRSLTLLSVSTQPAKTWHVNYYEQRQINACSQKEALLKTLYNIFGDNFPCHGNSPHHLIGKFHKELENIPLTHSLFKMEQLPTGGVTIPLMICGSEIDNILSYSEINDWEKWLKPEDNLWKYPQGGHFFHCFYPKILSMQILRFLQFKSFNIIKNDIIKGDIINVENL